MASVKEIRKSVTDTTPYYAVVGAVDLAVEKVREAGDYAGKAQATLTSVDADAVRADVVAQYRKVLRDAQDAPAAALSKAIEVAEKLSDQAVDQYDALAVRGAELLKRLETQQATQDLVKQYDATVALSKGAVTTAKKAFADTQASAKATVTTLNRQAEKVAGVVGDVVSSDVADAKASVKESADTVAAAATTGAKATTSAAKRTSTTARKSAKATSARTKAANTSARKTATRASKATAAGAEKVGD